MLDQLDALDSGAIFSSCRRWRYLLWRRWDRDQGACAFIGLNPSTADETEDDPTVRRMIRFARDWGYGACWVLNAYAFRATDPRVMRAEGLNALGPQNNMYLQQAGLCAEFVVAAWGVHCAGTRQEEIRRMYAFMHKPLYLLGQAKDGSPRHPLYLRADTQPVRWLPPVGVRAASAANG